MDPVDVVRGESSEFETLGIVDPVNSGSSEWWIPPNLRFLDRKRFSGFPAHSIEKEARFTVSMQRHKIVKFSISSHHKDTHEVIHVAEYDYVSKQYKMCRRQLTDGKLETVVTLL